MEWYSTSDKHATKNNNTMCMEVKKSVDVHGYTELVVCTGLVIVFQKPKLMQLMHAGLHELCFLAEESTNFMSVSSSRLVWLAQLKVFQSEFFS